MLQIHTDARFGPGGCFCRFYFNFAMHQVFTPHPTENISPLFPFFVMAVANSVAVISPCTAVEQIWFSQVLICLAAVYHVVPKADLSITVSPSVMSCWDWIYPHTNVPLRFDKPIHSLCSNKYSYYCSYFLFLLFIQCVFRMMQTVKSGGRSESLHSISITFPLPWIYEPRSGPACFADSMSAFLFASIPWGSRPSLVRTLSPLGLFYSCWETGCTGGIAN